VVWAYQFLLSKLTDESWPTPDIFKARCGHGNGNGTSGATKLCLATQGAALRVTSMSPVLLTQKTRWRSSCRTSVQTREFDITRREA